MSKHIGILVISANPPHETHLRRALEALEAGLDRVCILPVPCAPDKPIEQQIKFDHKVAMCRLLVAESGDGRIQVSDALRDCPPTHTGYTTCGLRAAQSIAAAQGASDVVFIGGTDRAVPLRGMVALMGVWQFFVLRRHGGLGTAIAGAASQHVKLGSLVLAREPESCSSAQIRESLCRAVRYPTGLPPSVAEYIWAHKLFGTDPESDFPRVLCV